MTSYSAQALIFTKYCNEGLPDWSNFELRSVTVSDADLAEGSILIKLLGVSPDPYMRGRMRTDSPLAAKGSSSMAMTLNDAVTAFVVGEVVASRNDKWPVGATFGASLPIQTVQVVTAKQMAATVMWNLTDYVARENITLGLGVFGMPGSTAYGGTVDVLQPKTGEVLFVSGASGAVGSLVGLIAKRCFGCRVIGSCGGPEKCAYVKDVLGFDDAIDYRKYPTRETLTAALAEVAPDGIDMYFDNVGGIHFEAAFDNLRPGGRIAVCGGISEYSKGTPNGVHFNPLKMIYTNQRIEGFVCWRWLSGAKGDFLKEMSGWMMEGKLHTEETYFDGLSSWVDAFTALMNGKHLGKVVIRNL